MRPSFLLLALALGLVTPALAQPGRNGGWVPTSSNNLAQDYARRGEHEKAVFLFEKMPLPEQAGPAVLPTYVGSLLALKKYKDAEKLLKVGESLREAKLDTVELAAWTMVANVLLNLDETITKN